MMDTNMELKTGELQFGLLHGADNKSPIAEQKYEKGVLRDLGYFSRLQMQSE